MSPKAMCRVCLASNVRLYSLMGSPLLEILEKLTIMKASPADGNSIVACYICYHILVKCHQIVTKAKRAEELLTQQLQGGDLTHKSITDTDRAVFQLTHRLTASPVETISLGEEVEEIKDEIQVKKETKHEPEFEDRDYSSGLPSDSEDDVPLKNISTKFNSGKRANVRKNNIGSISEFAREIILSKAEQLAELQQRAQSQNYLGSPLKCHLCYKGFIDLKAFTNHKEKHDVSSGAHACDVCHMRYQSARQLRTHIAHSHGRQYQCRLCDHRSHTTNQAREHQKWHDGHTYECKLCGQIFSKSTSYFTHKRKRHPSEYICNICGHRFVSRHGLMTHKTKTHKDQPSVNVKELPEQQYCSECNIQFATPEAWKQHILSSIKHSTGYDNSSACKICGETFSNGSLLSKHVKTHFPRPAAPVARPAELRCDQCESKFATRSQLQAHVKRAHLGLKYNKNIVCEVCGKKCTSQATLVYHQRTHTGERPFECGTCSKRFSDKNQLRIHGRSHTGERPYGCSHCGKRFSQKPALNRHMRVHTGDKPYTCQYCSKPFSQSNSLKTHIKAIHLKIPSNRKKSQTAPKIEDSLNIERNHQAIATSS